MEKLSSPVILGMSWLTAANPKICWPKYEIVFEKNGRKTVVYGNPKGMELPTVELCSAKVGIKAIR